MGCRISAPPFRRPSPRCLSPNFPRCQQIGKANRHYQRRRERERQLACTRRGKSRQGEHGTSDSTPGLHTDNALMIAYTAAHHLAAGNTSSTSVDIFRTSTPQQYPARLASAPLNGKRTLCFPKRFLLLFLNGNLADVNPVGGTLRTLVRLGFIFLSMKSRAGELRKKSGFALSRPDRNASSRAKRRANQRQSLAGV